MDPTDQTIEILKDIRDGVRDTNERIDRTNERLEDLGASLNAKIEDLGASLGTRIDRTNERLEVVARRQTEMEMRLATEVIAVSGAVHEVSDLLREDRGLRQRVEDHERRLRAIETRTE